MTLDEKIRTERATTRKLSRIYRSFTGAVFAVLIAASLVVWVMQFNDKVTREKNDIARMLADRGDAMSNVLQTAYYRVAATRDWMQDYLDYSTGPRGEDMVRSLKEDPGLGYYFSDSSENSAANHDDDDMQFWGGLYGYGMLEKIDRTPIRHIELDVAMHLYKLKRIQRKSVGQYFLWFMYISKNDFVVTGGLSSLTVDFHRAFMSGNVQLMLQKLYDNRLYWKDAMPENNPDRAITWDRVDGLKSAGLIVTISSPIYNRDEFMGAYVCRISPAILEKYTANPEVYKNGNVILMNQYDQVICSTVNTDWRDPKVRDFSDEIMEMTSRDYDDESSSREKMARSFTGKLAGEIQRSGKGTSAFAVNGYYVFIQPLKDVPWQFIYVVPRKSVWLAAMGMQEYFFLPLIMLALMLVLIVPHMVFRKYFVTPVIELVRFMRMSSFRSNPTIPNVPDAWKPWFQEVSQLPHLQNIAHSMPGAMFQVKLADERGKGVLGFVSESISNMLDERIEAILENLRSDLLYYFDENERQRLLDESRRILKKGGNLDMQCRITTSQGRMRWLRIMGTPRVDDKGETMLEGILLDYTEQNETARTVQEQQSILQMLTEAAIEGVFINNEETIIQANQAFADMFGYSRVEDVLGRSVNDFLAPEAYGMVQQKIKSNFTGYYELKCMRRSGEIFDAEIHVRQTQFGSKKLRAGAIRDISNRKSYESDMKRRDRILRCVTEMAEMFITETDFTGIFDRCFPALGDAVDVNRITVYRKDETLDQLVLCPEYTWATSKLEKAHALSLPNIVVPRDGGPIKRWIDRISVGEAVYGNSGDFITSEKALLSSYGLRSVAVVPVFVDNEWWGCMLFGVSDRDRDWKTEVLDGMKMAGDLFAGAIQRERVMNEIIRTKQRETSIGGIIQDRLLRSVPPKDIADTDIAVISVPSEEIDGDFYDFIKYDNTHFDVIIGDVMGKGVSAALLGAAAKAQFMRGVGNFLCTSSLTLLPTPEEVVNYLNDTMCRELMSLDSFMTICYARFDMDKMRMDYVNSGHPRVIHYHADKNMCEFLSDENYPIGFDDSEYYQQSSVKFSAGDLFFFYSDGLIESKCPTGELFGVERVSDIIKNNASLAPNELTKKIYENLVSFSMSVSFSDDLTFVAVKILPKTECPLVICKTRLFQSNVDVLKPIRDFIQDQLLEAGKFDHTFIEYVLVASNETATNIICHGSGKSDVGILVQIDAFSNRAEIRLTYSGGEFVNMLVSSPAFDGSQEHGFGLFMSRQCVDEMIYSEDEAQNTKTIKLIKYIKQKEK